jgi:hypothetical protein
MLDSILVEYTLFDSPKKLYTSVTKSDLTGAATLLELIAGGHQYPASSVKVLDLIPE